MPQFKTVLNIPGFGKHNRKETRPEQNTEANIGKSMIAGFLYSVSRGVEGELFPVYVGKNRLGSGENATIILSEKTVLPEHALLLVRRYNDINGELKTIAKVNEAQYDAAIRINDKPLAEGSSFINDGDKLQIGEAYTFLFRILSPENTGLTSSENFVAIAPPVKNDNRKQRLVEELARDEIFYPSAISEEDEESFYKPSKPRVSDNQTSQTIVEER